MEQLSDIQVIYVEDDEVDRHIFGLVFNKITTNSTITFIKSGQEFLDFLYKKNTYRNRADYKGKIIIFLDINMPGISGLDVLKKLSEHSSLNQDGTFPPIIMFSASRRDIDIAESKHFGATEYIVKPFSYQEMQSSLTSIFSRYLLTDELKETSI